MAKLLMWAKTRNLYFWKGITENFKKVLSKWDALGNKGAISFGTPFGGINANGEQLVLNSKGQVGIDFTDMLQGIASPTSIITGSDITFSSSTSLNGDIACNNLTINSGVTLTTNGYSIFCNGTFTNNGTITTGLISNGGASSAAGGSLTKSYGGSGGGAGAISTNGGAGGSTLVAGGSGGVATDGNGGNGSSNTSPTLSSSLIQTWYNNGFHNYLGGAGGGGSSTNVGGNGSYGIYIQADKIIAGSINANGAADYQVGGTGSTAGGGGGGGGVIILAYGGGGYTAGTYSVTGGASTAGSTGGSGGSGGNGLAISYSYGSTAPISISSGYTALPASTNGTVIASFSYTAQFGKPIKIQVVGSGVVSGVTVYLQQNSTTIGTARIDSNGTYILDGFIGNSQIGTTYTVNVIGNNTTTSTVNLYVNSYIMYEVAGGI